MLSDEMMFYTGVAVMIIALVLLIVVSVLLKIKQDKLNAQFDVEYGMETKLETQKDNKSKT